MPVAFKFLKHNHFHLGVESIPLQFEHRLPQNQGNAQEWKIGFGVKQVLTTVKSRYKEISILYVLQGSCAQLRQRLLWKGFLHLSQSTNEDNRESTGVRSRSETESNYTLTFQSSTSVLYAFKMVKPFKDQNENCQLLLEECSRFGADVVEFASWHHHLIGVLLKQPLNFLIHKMGTSQYESHGIVMKMKQADARST